MIKHSLNSWAWTKLVGNIEISDKKACCMTFEL